MGEYLNLAQRTRSALRSSVELSRRELFIVRFEEFAEVNRLGDFMVGIIRASRVFWARSAGWFCGGRRGCGRRGAACGSRGGR